uniref:Uncharacterized protein n=1 Tax=viral metagenome TaxID=1070528 RepID=A0A6M3IQX6_9ZZZZ
MRSITGVSRSAADTFDYYCRQCGRLHTQKEIPVLCKECGNTESDEGFGVSGDNSVSNTTTTVTKRVGTFTRVTTIDKRRR